VFEHRCGMCHRQGGTGTFILARRLGAERSLLEKRSDLDPDYIRTVVRWGLVNMPRISRVEVPEPDMDALVAYLTAPKAPQAP
jgi:mono/diheme cytochrome c family protein